MKVKFFLEELADPTKDPAKFLIENFKRVRDVLKDLKITNAQFQFLEIDIPDSVFEQDFAHNLGFLPKDVIQTSSIGLGSLTWNYEKFTATNLNFTTTGPCIVRAFIGSYKEE